MNFAHEIQPFAFVFFNFRSLSRRAACVSGFFHHPIDKRIACPYKFSKRSGRRLGEEDLGGSVRAAARIALAGRCHRPGRAIMAADNIPLNDCLARPMISGSSGIKFTRDFRPTRTVFADDAIHAQGTKSDKYFCMKFDSPVLLPKRGHGIAARIN
jgi:hypothetical protein